MQVMLMKMMMGCGIEEEDAATGASDHDSGDKYVDDSNCDQCSA